MRLYRFLTVAALTTMASANLVTSSPAMAQTFQEGLSVHVPSLPTAGSQQQVPMSGKTETIAQTPERHVGPQTAQVPDQGEVNASPAFVAPGVQRNAAGRSSARRDPHWPTHIVVQSYSRSLSWKERPSERSSALVGALPS
jgi:hypothetical protein